MCFSEGDPISYKNLLTPEQQAMMSFLGAQLAAGAQQGATPFKGLLSTGPNPMMNAAMNTMSNVGGYGNYKPPKVQTQAYPAPGQIGTWGAYDPAYYGGRGWKDRRGDGDNKIDIPDYTKPFDPLTVTAQPNASFDPLSQFLLNQMMTTLMQGGDPYAPKGM